MQRLNTPPLRPIRKAPRPAARERGSVLLFCVIVVLLLTMMGAAYLQMARMDRRATRDVDTRSQNIDGSIIRFIGDILGDDVLEDSDVKDYPWTNGGETFEVKDYLARDGSPLGNAEGGDGDDAWLAPFEPSAYSSPNVTWAHLSNLRGVWLDMGDLWTGPDGEIWPRQHLTTANSHADTGDTNVVMPAELDATTSAKWADADGDGIADSRWTWAPLPAELGKTWVMAVRIIDNSALVNVNVWAAPPAAGADASRWYWPTELNLVEPFNQLGGSMAVTPILAHRFNGTDPAVFENRYWHWLAGPRQWNKYNDADDLTEWQYISRDPSVETLTPPGTTDYEKFEADDEIELRWRNGLNKSSDNTTNDPASPIEAIDANTEAFFRQAGALETKYDNVVGAGNHQQWFEAEPRKHLTTVSGAAPLDQRDLNHASSEELKALATSAAGGSVPLSGGSWTAESFGNQFAATVADWIDGPDDPTVAEPVDNGLTKVADRYGMEYLPFISEVYVAATYRDPENDSEWTITGDGVAYGIEIFNPFPVPISLSDVRLRVNGEDWGDLSALDPQLGPYEFVRLYRNTPAFNIGGDHALSEDWPTAAAFGGATVSLEVPNGSGGAVIYQKFGSQAMATNVTSAPSPEEPEDHYAVVHSLGTANGVNALAVLETEVLPSTPSLQPVSVSPPNPRWENYWKDSGLDDRVTDAAGTTSAAPATAPAPGPGDEPFLIASTGRAWRSGDVLRMVFVGPTDTQTIAEVWAGAAQIKDFMIDLADPAAHELLGRLTVNDPREDAADIRNEGLVPGLINVNTAPQRVLEWALPATGVTGSGGFAESVVSARSAPGQNGLDYVSQLHGVMSGVGGLQDFNEAEELFGPPPDTDGHSGDREEAVGALTYLNQVLTTRSDVFTAYVVVRSYPSNDFTTHEEEYRLIAVYDRSRVRERSPLPRVLGVAVVRNP